MCATVSTISTCFWSSASEKRGRREQRTHLHLSLNQQSEGWGTRLYVGEGRRELAELICSAVCPLCVRLQALPPQYSSPPPLPTSPACVLTLPPSPFPLPPYISDLHHQYQCFYPLVVNDNYIIIEHMFLVPWTILNTILVSVVFLLLIASSTKATTMPSPSSPRPHYRHHYFITIITTLSPSPWSYYHLHYPILN